MGVQYFIPVHIDKLGRYGGCSQIQRDTGAGRGLNISDNRINLILHRIIMPGKFNRQVRFRNCLTRKDKARAIRGLASGKRPDISPRQADSAFPAETASAAGSVDYNSSPDQGGQQSLTVFRFAVCIVVQYVYIHATSLCTGPFSAGLWKRGA
jgi:hypothetical protein